MYEPITIYTFSFRVTLTAKLLHKVTLKKTSPLSKNFLLPSDVIIYAERGIATASRLSVCPSVTLGYRDHIGWNTSKIISLSSNISKMRQDRTKVAIEVH